MRFMRNTNKNNWRNKMIKFVEITTLAVLVTCTAAILAEEKPALRPLNKWWTAEYVQMQIERARAAGDTRAELEWEKWKKRNIKN